MEEKTAEYWFIMGAMEVTKTLARAQFQIYWKMEMEKRKVKEESK